MTKLVAKRAWRGWMGGRSYRYETIQKAAKCLKVPAVETSKVAFDSRRDLIFHLFKGIK